MEWGQTEAFDGLTFKEGPMAILGEVTITDMPIKNIKLARNSRLDVTDESIAGLMQSIKETGLLQPIGVVKNGKGYEICYGNRRFMACSKLGWTKIPALVHKDNSVKEIDLKNLTENLQRRSISLMEAGRYMSLLKEQDLSSTEIGIRLGVSKSYVSDCLDAYNRVPKEFQKDIETRAKNDRQRLPGKISVNVARAIVNSTKRFALDKEEQAVLYRAAKTSDRFEARNTDKYAVAVKGGSQNPTEDVPHVKNVKVSFYMKEDDYAALETKHVVNGPFANMGKFFIAVLKGEKSDRIKVYSKKD